MLNLKITPFALIVGFFVGILTAKAQSLAYEESGASVTPAPLEQAPVDTYRPALSDPGGGGGFQRPSTPFVWGPLSLYPHLDYSYSYGNGVEATPGTSLDTVAQTVSPGLHGTVGSHWTFDYTPSWSFYSNNAFSDTVGQSAFLSLAVPTGDWNLNLSQGYSYSTIPLIVTGAQTTQTSYTTQLAVSHAISSKISLSSGLSQTLESGNALGVGAPILNTNDWSATGSINYIISPRIDSSLGITGDYTQQVGAGATELVSVGPQARIGYRPDEAFHFDIHGGFQTQIFITPDFPDRNNPIFGTALLYTPFQNTQLTLSLDHSAGFAYLTGQATTSTIASASLQQGLLEHLNINAGVSGNKIAYADSTTVFNRADQLRSYNLGLGTSGLLRHGTISISYQVSRNRSSLSEFDLSTHQITLQIGYHY